eukprot:3917016-Amphidinium_carterae.1
MLFHFGLCANLSSESQRKPYLVAQPLNPQRCILLEQALLTCVWGRADVERIRQALLNHKSHWESCIDSVSWQGALKHSTIETLVFLSSLCFDKRFDHAIKQVARSNKHAAEILEHETVKGAWEEIEKVVAKEHAEVAALQNVQVLPDMAQEVLEPDDLGMLRKPPSAFSENS